MKTNKIQTILLCLLFIFSISCSDDDDNRTYQDITIKGVNVDGELYLPTVSERKATIDLPAGKALDAVKIQLLVANGDLIDFDNDAIYDCRKAIHFSIKSKNGGVEDWSLKLNSAPSMSSFVVEGLNVSLSDVFIGKGKFTVGVPIGTDLTALKVSMTFLNGTIRDFENGKVMDYSDKKHFSVLGVDEETIYEYDLRITTAAVGPASISAITVNGVTSDSVSINDKKEVQAYFSQLVNFASSSIEFTCGADNIVDPGFISTGVNLLKGDVKVKITGTNDVEDEFSILTPKVIVKPILSKANSDFGFQSASPQAIGFSNNEIIIGSYQAGTQSTPAGILRYNLTGEYLGALSTKGTNIDTGAKLGIRKMATDINGVILGIQLGVGAQASEEIKVFKWDTPTSEPVPYISYTQTGLGLGYSPRTGNIAIAGSLNGDAIITIPLANGNPSDVLIYTVTGGNLNPTPVKKSLPYKCNAYYSVEPLPIGTKGFVAAYGNASKKGLGLYSEDMTESFVTKISGDQTYTDCKAFKHNNRIYLAYATYANAKTGYYRICDITEKTEDSFYNPIFEVQVEIKGAPGNDTMDADLFTINGKLHASFLMTGTGVEVYCLEK